MPQVGKILLILLALSSAIGTWRFDFDKHHLFNQSWPPHARFHGAAFAILTICCSLLALFWLCFTPFGEASSITAACSLLAVNAVSLGGAALVPGVSTIARADEKVWFQVPISIWMVLASLLITGLGFLLAVEFGNSLRP